jgi:hypothetical protein
VFEVQNVNPTANLATHTQVRTSQFLVDWSRVVAKRLFRRHVLHARNLPGEGLEEVGG